MDYFVFMARNMFKVLNMQGFLEETDNANSGSPFYNNNVLVRWKQLGSQHVEPYCIG